MADDNIVYLTLITILGLCIGSFLNVIIYRVPKQLRAGWEKDSRDFLGLNDLSLSVESTEEKPVSIVFPPSHCPKCGASIKPWQNIPVISYLFLRGKCASCAAPISIQYPLIEILSAITFVVGYLHFGLTVNTLFFMFFSLVLLTLTGIDFQTQLLPDNLTYPLLWVGLVANSQDLFTSLPSAVYGALLGYLCLWTVYWAFKLLTGKEGMGYGDFKLLAALGAWTGWEQLPLIILLSSLVGAVVGFSLVLAMGRDRKIPIAFGPYLAIAGWISLLWGTEISAIYLRLLA